VLVKEGHDVRRQVIARKVVKDEMRTDFCESLSGALRGLEGWDADWSDEEGGLSTHVPRGLELAGVATLTHLNTQPVKGCQLPFRIDFRTPHSIDETGQYRKFLGGGPFVDCVKTLVEKCLRDKKIARVAAESIANHPIPSPEQPIIEINGGRRVIRLSVP